MKYITSASGPLQSFGWLNLGEGWSAGGGGFVGRRGWVGSVKL